MNYGPNKKYHILIVIIIGPLKFILSVPRGPKNPSCGQGRFYWGMWGDKHPLNNGNWKYKSAFPRI